MRNTRLIELLNKCSKNDWIDISVYIKSSLKETSPDAHLFDYIKRYKRNLESPNLNMDVARKVISPDLTAKSFSNVLYRLTAHIEKYLVLQYLESADNEFEYNTLLARVYKKKGLNKQFTREIKFLRRKAERSNKIDVWQNMHLVRLYYEYYLSDAVDEDLVKENIFEESASILEECNKQLALFYLTERINIEHYWGGVKDIKLPAFLESENLINENDYDRLLYCVYSAVKTKSEKKYLKLKSEFIKNKDSISMDLYFFILVQLFNQIVHLTKQGMSKYARDMLLFYDLGLRSGVLLKNKKLSEKRFLNILGFACKLKEWDWVHNFKTEWSENIESRHRNEVVTLANAYESFAKEDYKDVLITLNHIKSYKNVGLSLRAKWLTLSSLYEIYEDDEPTYQHIANFRSYLSRNKKQMSKATFKGTENYIKVVELMIKHVSKEDIRAFVKGCEFLNFRLWIEEKLNRY